MKILQIGPIPPEIGGKTIGGVATHVWNLATQLFQCGHQVAILADNYRTKTVEPKTLRDVIIFGNTTSLRNLDFNDMITPAWWQNVYRAKHHFGKISSWQQTAFEISKYQKIIASFKPICSISRT